jgi:preprotein translocase subunit SecD
MSVTKEWRITILILLILLSGALVWRPWQGLNPQNRGIQFGIDITGGSRIYLKLEASQVTLKLDNVDAFGEIDNILKNNELSIINVATPYDNVKKTITVEIGQDVTKERIENLIDNLAQVISITGAVSSSTIDEVTHSLALRVDPFGTLGTQFTSVGSNLVRFEVALPLDRAVELLGQQGRLEIFIEDNLVLFGSDITGVGSVQLDTQSNSYSVPFDLSQNGANKWASFSAGKVNYPTAIYLDRQSDDTMLLFDEGLLAGLQGMTYDENRRMFLISPSTLGTGILAGVHLQVTSVAINETSLSQQTVEFLRAENGIKTKIILLGNISDYSKNVLSTIENLGYPTPENFSRRPNEATIDWVERVCGLKSTPTITDAVAGKPLTSMVITTGGNSDAAKKRADDLKVVLSQRLSVGISYESEESLDPRLGKQFINQAVLALSVAIAGVGLLVYLRYRHLKISGAIMGTMLSELVITLGMASAFGWTIGLPEIGGLVAIVGSGVNHQIIITDEVIRGALPHARKVGLQGRISRAFTIIFAAAATVIAAMISLALVGFGVMRGFALITMAGVLLAVLLTRPVYARVLSFIMEREKPEIAE